MVFLHYLRIILFRPLARQLAENHPRKHGSTIQPSLKYNKVKLPEYRVSEEITRNISGGKRGGFVYKKRREPQVLHIMSRAFFSYYNFQSRKYKQLANV